MRYGQTQLLGNGRWQQGMYISIIGAKWEISHEVLNAKTTLKKRNDYNI